MSELTEHKSWREHYYRDKQHRRQGEYKDWHENGQPWEQCLYKDNKRHGECKWWNVNGVRYNHAFFQVGTDITEEVIALVEDISNITHKEKMIIKLKFGVECL